MTIMSLIKIKADNVLDKLKYATYCGKIVKSGFSTVVKGFCGNVTLALSISYV